MERYDYYKHAISDIRKLLLNNKKKYKQYSPEALIDALKEDCYNNKAIVGDIEKTGYYVDDLCLEDLNYLYDVAKDSLERKEH